MSSTGKTTTKEFDERQKKLANEEGTAYQRSLRHMIEDVAHTGDMVHHGDYVVGFAQEKAEGLYHVRGGSLEWVEPAEEDNCHVEVAVADADDGRFIPGMNPTVRLVGDDEEIGPIEPGFIWHPGLYHYGANVHLPGDGTYDVRIEIDAPEFPRHDRKNGDRYTEGIEVVFEDVGLKTGRA